jgi:hypothetical protein
MAHAGPDERAALINGFRALADFLESNPDVPPPGHADIYAFPLDGECDRMHAEVDAVSELLGCQARETAGGEHYSATRSFGPVEYQISAICKHEHHDGRQG